MKKNLKNRTIFCRDNLEILMGINSGCVDLIYLDPPFNKKKTFTAPIGSSAEGAEFKDIFTLEDIKQEWVETIREEYLPLYELLDFARKADGVKSYNFCYLTYMAIRLLEMRRILKDTGSIYLHCDPTMSHYLKLAMDCIFGESNFRNEIIWHYSNKQQILSGSHFLRATDSIFYYAKTKATQVKQIETILSGESRGQQVRERGYNLRTIQGKKYCDVYNWKKYQERVRKGKIDVSTPTRDLSKKKQIRYEDNCWEISIINPRAKERIGYPTQKPLALLERIIRASSRVGDLILDPFCGCATTCVAAEKLDREWVGIDISMKAYDLVKVRLEKEVKGREELDKNTGQVQTQKNMFKESREVHAELQPPRRTARLGYKNQAKNGQ